MAKYWKISPGPGGSNWEDWLKKSYCVLYDWKEQPYFDKINTNLKNKYRCSEEFFEKAGYKGGLKNDWRQQLKTFVWDITVGDYIFAYKKGSFVGWGKIEEKTGEYYYDDEGHKRNVEWIEFSPALNLEGTELIEKLAVRSAGTIKNIDDYRGEINNLIRKKGLNIL
ncbi:hypothetical protein DRN70_02615 [Methanosarcinales archaeon]|nr:MAG: hypothetical protein DRN70_02615 [Methanosarcinales archaeon]